MATEKSGTNSNGRFKYGPQNPHPLSQMRTELIWEGKYDEYGSRREIDIAGAGLPLQRIETVDEPRSRAEAIGNQQDLFSLKEQAKKLGDFRNLLVWGDNKLVMGSLLQNFEGRIDLIYIDPPFDVGADFTMDVPIGDEGETVSKDQSTLEMVAYRDMWGKGTDSYLHMMFERLTLMKQLLSEKGALWLHCDFRMGHHLQLLCTELFGSGRSETEVIFKRRHGHSDSSTLGNVHDMIFLFAKGPNFRWNPQYTPYTQEYKDTYYRYKDADGRRWLSRSTTAPGGRGPVYEWNGITRAWRYTIENMKRLHEEGRLFYTENGMPRYKQYLDEMPGAPLTSLWTDIQFIDSWSSEDTGYETQKPEALLERIIRASSNDGDLVADFFCGSGTTGAVAERLGRRWVMSDLGRFAIHTTRKRLIELQRKLHEQGKPYRAFDVYNLGRYERQWWQKERLRGADDEHRHVVLKFYKAEPLVHASSPLLHGKKGAAFVHVSAIDSLLTRPELRSIGEATRNAGATQVNCLAWEFEMDLRLEANKLQAELGIEIRLVRIPREIMEKNRSSVTFFEIATLEGQPVYKGSGKERSVDIKLLSFLPSLAEVPEEELEALNKRAIKHGFDFIDFWAIDFDYSEGQPFKHHWQAYRTKRDRRLPTVSDHEFKYAKSGHYLACVKVVDTFGCDTSITVPIKG